MSRYNIVGYRQLLLSIKRLESLPQRFVTKAAKSGASIALKSARSDAPMDTGALRKGIILKGERRTVVGKKVYDVMMDPAMNDVFQKTTKSGLRRVTNGKKAKTAKGNYYYPASQEFGFMTVNGGYIPGFHFLKDSIEGNSSSIENKVVAVLSKEIDKVLSKR